MQMDEKKKNFKEHACNPVGNMNMDPLLQFISMVPNYMKPWCPTEKKLRSVGTFKFYYYL